MSAREVFAERLSLIIGLISNPLLIDNGIANSPHNASANILRNGLVISAFAAFESYVEDGLAERMRILSRSKLKYAGLDPDLKWLLTVDALQGLATRAAFVDSSDRQAYVEAHVPGIAKFTLSRPTYTAWGFSPKGSNVGSKDITGVLKALKLQGGWNLLSTICSNIGFSVVGLDARFSNFQNARNKAAHDSAASISTIGLREHCETALLVAVSFDLACTHAIKSHSRAISRQQAQNSANQMVSSFRYLTQRGTAWEEALDAQILGLHATLSAARSIALSRRPGTPIIVRSNNLLPLELIWS